MNTVFMLEANLEAGPHWHDIPGVQVTQYSMWRGEGVLVATSINMNTFHVPGPMNSFCRLRTI